MNSIYLIFLHFLSDWILQPRKIAETKSKNRRNLLIHVVIIFMVFFVGCLLFMPPVKLFVYCFINSATHYFIDKYVWTTYKAANKNKPKEWFNKNMWAKDEWFYNTIAFDSFMHLSIILLLFGIN